MFQLGHNVYCDSCKDNVKTCDDHHRIYFGRKFYKATNGYWVCSRARLPWAHRWVWMHHHGDIPKGFDVHHIDGDKSNNAIENLQLMTRSEHLLIHWQERLHIAC